MKLRSYWVFGGFGRGVYESCYESCYENFIAAVDVNCPNRGSIRLHK